MSLRGWAWATVFPVLLLPCSFAFRRYTWQRNAEFPLLVRTAEGPPGSAKTVIPARDVRTVLVRENVGRDRSEDAALAQIYLLRGGGTRPLLVSCHYLGNRDVVPLAERIAEALGAKLKVELPPPSSA